MASINYDLKVVAKTGLESKRDLSSRERTRLFAKPNIDDSKPKRPIVNRLAMEAPAPKAEARRPSARERLERLKAGNEAIIAEANTQLERLSEQAQGLVYEFDPTKKPELARALGNIFEGASNRITFQMYRSALELESELSLQVGGELADGIL